MIATRLFGALASFLVLAVMFAPLERAFPARAGQRWLRPAYALDVCFFLGQYLLWSALALGALAAIRSASGGAALEWLRQSAARQPLIVQAIEVIALGDLLVYWWHRACHASAFLWRFHAVHHSAEHLDWLAAHREHPLDGLTTQLAQNLPAFVLGFPLQTIAALAAFRGAWGIFIHSNVRLRLGLLGLIAGAPELHHWHHARLQRTRHNFANLAPWLDVLFGTYHRPEGDETYPLGLDAPGPRSYWRQLLAPFRSGNLPQ
ncbi:MAG TPA: sterol desaturase family protein [Polyangia bacterium]|nr:sterol desaturase family protein [Polyangia bacterium]